MGGGGGGAKNNLFGIQPSVSFCFIILVHFLYQHMQITSQAELYLANTIITCFRNITDTRKIYISQ